MKLNPTNHTLLVKYLDFVALQPEWLDFTDSQLDQFSDFEQNVFESATDRQDPLGYSFLDFARDDKGLWAIYEHDEDCNLQLTEPVELIKE